jgi:hypothetical protein
VEESVGGIFRGKECMVLRRSEVVDFKENWMPCWVAPAIAADMWGISVEQVMAGISNGAIPSRIDGSFLFVMMHTQNEPVAAAAPVKEVVQGEEETSAGVLTSEEQMALGEFRDEDEAEMEEVESSGVNQMDISQWRQGRAEASRMRQPPRPMVA